MPLTAVLSLAAFGFAYLDRRSRERSSAAVFAATLGLTIALSSVVLSVFGAMLKANTHHRGLGGVTFAIVSGLVVIGLGAVASRFAMFVVSRQKDPTWVERGGMALIALGGLYVMARAGFPGKGMVGIVCIAGALGAFFAAKAKSPARRAQGLEPHPIKIGTQ